MAHAQKPKLYISHICCMFQLKEKLLNSTEQNKLFGTLISIVTAAFDEDILFQP
jgi:hypothetical protein